MLLPVGLNVRHSARVYLFLFENISMLTCSGVRRDRIVVTVSPAAENTHSDGTDVAGMHRYLYSLLTLREATSIHYRLKINVISKILHDQLSFVD